MGGLLRPHLEETGRPVRCLTRRPEALEGRVAPTTEVVFGDLFEPGSLDPALEGVDTAYYLVHSMESPGSFEERDRRAATNFVEAAERAGVRRIVYLGGLGDPEGPLSPHLRSRQETGRILRSRRVQGIEFRASIILGAGSLSFEMVRALTERLPVMLCPRWVRVSAQPIGIEDVLAYLLEALELEEGPSRVFEIGGPESISYRGLMLEYARQRGLRRWLIPVPVLTPRLSSLWLSLVTPLYAQVGRKLVESLRHPTVVQDPDASRVFSVRPAGVREAIERALEEEDRHLAEVRWSEVLPDEGDGGSGLGASYGPRLLDSRVAWVGVPPEVAFRPIQRIGGETGWYHAGGLWRLRGLLDRLLGGHGLRRGRVHPEALEEGDVIDFWRVERLEPGARLRLRAEMRVPGRAWLDFETAPEEGGTRIRQTASFDPRGVIGRLYWYGLHPVHGYVFRGMLRAIAREAGRMPHKVARP